ncbi:UNVERIFIED_CONTAM: EAL domain-containing protein [Halobacillus marinus]|uniref:bifunctional diguanylate cyclase/phosphodiesterase n=1 Tax=Halobacillus sp. BAB-2008 TaxID=1246484 RepID=UPI00187C86CB|nr:bifunctional diguanylate cyclase/phosphodiesterase [Halobacillus sp. BAB-2008]
MHEEILGQYNWWLVVLSIAVSILSSYTALLLVRRMMQTEGAVRWKWLLIGSLTFGVGIWSMHFVAMLAYKMDMVVTYKAWGVTLSVIAAIFSSFLAFYLISRKERRWFHHILGSVLIGLSIVSMHYIGMDAMEMGMRIEYDPLWVALSIGIALAASFAALQLFTISANVKREEADYTNLKWWGSSLGMGAAISGMHYTGMYSASFHPMEEEKISSAVPVIDPTLLGLCIAFGVMATIGFLIKLIAFDTKMESTTDRLHLANQMYKSIVESANDAVITSDASGRVLSWNRAAERIFGHRKEDMYGKSLRKLTPGPYEEGDLSKMVQVIGRTVELEGLHKAGHTFPVELSLAKIDDHGEVFYIGIIRDITERKEAHARIQELVFKDDLTQLPNRRALYEYLFESMQKEKSDASSAVMFLDLDRFKHVNDVYGHRIGDLLLSETAERMRGCLDEEDLLVRQSGDEFVVVLPEPSEGEARRKAESIMKAMALPFLIDDREIYMSVSIGISLFPKDGHDSELILKHADTAMYQAKQSGGNQCVFFTNQISAMISRKVQLEAGLRKAVERGEIEVHYQPQIKVSTGDVIGFEALVRWRHPHMGMISPAEFIPIAEETKLIIPLGELVLREACVQFQKWVDAGYKVERIAVNLSSVQFRQPSFLKVVETVMEETGMAPRHLEFELTESIVQDSETAIPVMHELKRRGFTLSLDDFGTGYSSLSYLKDFPLDTLKIDKSFIQTINENYKERAVVDAIISIAAKLDLSVIAEGVETLEQLEYLQGVGCEEYQGYYFSPPLSSEKVWTLLKKCALSQ